MIFAQYTIGNLNDFMTDQCDTCKYKDGGCEMRGRHIDRVMECFMFSEKKGTKKEVKK